MTLTVIPGVGGMRGMVVYSFPKGENILSLGNSGTETRILTNYGMYRVIDLQRGIIELMYGDIPDRPESKFDWQ